MRIFMRIFLYKKRSIYMQVTLIKNPDISAGLPYKVARIVYAHTGGISLPLVEAFTSMIKNLSTVTGQEIQKLITNSKYFSVLDSADKNHYRIKVSANDTKFQMCVRTAQRMISGMLGDCCFGATKFHSADIIPEWARSRGYIADIDGILFYT